MNALLYYFSCVHQLSELNVINMLPKKESMTVWQRCWCRMIIKQKDFIAFHIFIISIVDKHYTVPV